jgi:hypothetical protein
MSGKPEQLGLDFSRATNAKDGLTRWHEERQEALRDLARKLGLPLDHPAEVVLQGGIRLRGMLRLGQEELLIEPKRDLRLQLRIDRCTFLPTEIESCIRLD